MLTVFWVRNGPITISFWERGNTVNSENYCKLLTQVKKDKKNKRRGLQSISVILLQDNARPYTAAGTLAKIEDLGWKLLTHPPYSLDLAPSDFHLFGPLKESMRGIHFQTNEEVAQDSVHRILCLRNRRSNIKMEQVCCKEGRLC